MISLASDAAAAASELLPSLCGFNKEAMLPQSSQQNDADFFAKRRRSGNKKCTYASWSLM